MHGTAATESNYGTHPNTYRPGYHGGMFQVDKIGFKSTQDTKSHPGLVDKHRTIKRDFGIDWPNVRWEDLRDPTHSAIGARLHYMNDPNPVPGTREGRADYWKRVYNREAGKGTPQDYLNRSNPNFSFNTRTNPRTFNSLPQTKQASFVKQSDILTSAVLGSAAGLSGLGTSYALNSIIGNRLDRKLQEADPTNKQRYRQLSRNITNKYIPIERISDLGNAYYAPPEYYLSELDSGLFRKKPKDHRSRRKYGYISSDPEYFKDSILAHELGHAAIELNNKTPLDALSRLNQRSLSSFSDIANLIIPTTAAVGVGALAQKYKGINPLITMPTTAAALGILTGLPSILNEKQTTNKALKALRKNIQTPEDEENYQKNKSILRNALRTYILGSFAGQTAATLPIAAYMKHRYG